MSDVDNFFCHIAHHYPQVREAQAEQVLDLARIVAKNVDLLIVGGDLNSSPDSKVYSKFLGEGLTDPHIELENSREPRFHTWGHEKNTCTSEEDGYRIDYLFYKPQGNRLSNVRTSMFGILDAKAEGMSLSDHMGVQTNLEITFSTRQHRRLQLPLLQEEDVPTKNTLTRPKPGLPFIGQPKVQPHNPPQHQEMPVQHWTPSSRTYYLIHHLAPPCNVDLAFFSPLRPLQGIAESCLWGGCLCHHLPAPTRMAHLLPHPYSHQPWPHPLLQLIQGLL